MNDKARTVRVSPQSPPRRGHLPLGDDRRTSDRIEVTSRWLERGGRPWFPVTGEIHYSRLPRERWNEVLGHARAGGLDTVATYVLWQAHEPEPGRFRWDGNLDLRAFIELAARHGLDVVVRMGPWAHGEARRGGFPDWLVERGLKTRTNDPAYLELVRAFYAQTISRLAGLTHAEGGPVVGAQMDNELYDQPQHLAMLRRIAEDLGLRVPLWTATGWGGALVPETLFPLYSAYSDGFWEDSQTEWPQFAAHHFRYGEVRDDLSVGADLREALDGIVLDPAAVPLKDDAATPFATCEIGGGMHVAYHRRPLVTAQDVAALALAKIGSGSIWQGYYMYAGGTQRVGPHGTEQESHATGYPNDVPSLSYDFYAPIGEHGQIRPHHHLLRRLHLWLAGEGARLAPMGATVGGGSDDPGELRWAVRSDGHSGYLFLTTYQPPKRPLDAQKDVQVTVSFEDADVTVPTRPLDLPAGVSLVWPLRYPLAPGLVLRSATAQLVTRITDEDGVLVVLCATDGVPVELVLDGGMAVDGARSVGGTTVVDVAEPGAECVVDLPGVRVLVLDEASANRLYRLEVAGRERLVLSDAPVYALDGALVLHSEAERCTVAVLPAPAGLTADGGALAGPHGEGLWRTWSVNVSGAGARTVAADLHPHAPAPPDPARGGPMDRLSAPTDYSGAARVHLDVPGDVLDGIDRVLLRVTWTGDAGRAYVGDRLVSDHFWHGRTWDIDLTPWREDVAGQGVRLELLPWRRDTGVWVDPAVRNVLDGIAVASAEVVRVGRVVLAEAGA
ncbi:beta-galactosidase [Nonomuraea jabiensis]|uniref:beta-galactosidase n=1 Tax=Nonomuraea jabiensis TaxID=882448 RepID=UPI0034359A55